MKFLKTQKGVLISIIAISTICFAIYHLSDILENIGMVAIVMNWMPIIIGLITLSVYFIVNKFSKNHSWIVAIFGNALNLLILINLFLNK